ncbi:growth hormone secretagogue receptor type 1-like [Clavelina lepadiformis]|uniref:growth hormone secretagogue receptor type 1-like n=1 Tax=Clavelina lepadiformis TaxID=159417 RepID=UPI0040412B04
MSFSESPTSKVISTTDMLSLANNTFKLMFGETEIAITASIIFPLLVFGVVGNIVTIIVIYRSPKLKSTFNYVIFSICFSDLISALLSPLFLYRRTWGFLSWNLSDALCKIFWGGDNFTSVATSLHILLFAFFRLTSIMYPHWFNRITIKHVKVRHHAVCHIGQTTTETWLPQIDFGCLAENMTTMPQRLTRGQIPEKCQKSKTVDITKLKRTYKEKPIETQKLVKLHPTSKKV